MRAKRVDRPFLIATIILVLAGLFIFTSASLGIVVREDLKFSTIALKQIIVGVIGGSIVLLFFAKIDYKVWRHYAFYIFLASIFITLLVFVPGIGFEHGGATRWISLGPISFQPSELLKLGAVIYFAAWVSSIKDKIKTFKFGLAPLAVILVICGTILLLQPDTDTFLVLFMSLMAIYLAGGGRWRDVLIIGLVCALGLLILVYQRPYLKSRVTTFLDPSTDAYGAGYQIQQSLIAIGNGGIFGRGFGQSIQKFSYLPEPIGDSIFAVAAEEFGFLGSATIVFLFLFFTVRGLKIAAGSPDTFGRLAATGIVILIVSQAFINIGSMLGILPLTGIPLTFVSHGGTALIFALAEVGIVLNISKNKRT